MKKIFLLFALVYFPFMNGIAQEAVTVQAPQLEAEEPGLQGIWQMCLLIPNQEDPSKPQMRLSSAFKFLNKDGSFYNIMLSSQGSKITVLGTYEINSEGAYTEIIDRSYTNPADNNRKNRMDYELANEGRFLFLKYFTLNSNTGQSGEAREFWVRVEPGNPFARNSSTEN
ncbi:DUF4488 domain-containing protein [Bacteroidales bacterium OttesenSCG-928-M06]|nr:DUF4488 domain-containing protein [Bacteroidales bacterium OttesenSCG-928-M06]